MYPTVADGRLSDDDLRCGMAALEHAAGSGQRLLDGMEFFHVAGSLGSMKNLLRPLALTLALSAMLLRAFLPAGWMPDPDSAGALVICTMHGPVRAVPVQRHEHTLPDHGPQLCPFAAAAHLARLLAIATFPVPAFSEAIGQRNENVRFAPVALSYRVQSPRAPPILA
jgi:hypothetical protein